MPGWLTEILDYGPEGHAWQPPARLPTVADLRDAIRRCDLVLDGRPSITFAKQCFAKMMAAFEPNTKLSAEETKLRFSVWFEACADMGDGQWQEATREAIETMKWMPKPAEFRALVQSKRSEAWRRRERLRTMLDSHKSPAAKPFAPESDVDRTRGLRDSFRKVGDAFKAAGYERDLARQEGREPEAWATQEIAKPDPPPAVDPLTAPKPIPQSWESKIGLLHARIRFFTDMGMVDYVDQMKRELAELEREAA